MLLVDTSQYPVEDREEVMRGGFADLVGVDVAPVDGDALMEVRFRGWDMGDDCSLVSVRSSGLHFGRRPTRISWGESPVIGFGMMPSGACRFSQNDGREISAGGGLLLYEMAEAFSCHFTRGSEGVNLRIPLEVLDIPLRDVQKAAQWLPRSPLYGLACKHFQAMLRYTKEHDAPQPSAQQAALHMLRALVRSFDAD